MRPQTIAATAVCTLAVLTAGCATYRPVPLAPLEVLDRLESRTWPDNSPDRKSDSVDEASQGIGPTGLAAFAVTAHPQLASMRAQLGIQQALLVQAGLLPDPRFGWDAMDLLASEFVEGSSSTVDIVAGFGLMFPLPRPMMSGSRLQFRKRPAAASLRPSGT